MDIIKTVLMSLSSIVILFVLTRLMGYREVSQLSMFDYITGISIGSIAAEMATGLENFEKPLTAMVIYATAGVTISVLTNKSVRLRRNLMGQPIMLMNNGIIYYDRMKKAKIDISELLMELRARGFFNITEIDTIVLEINGKFSIIPRNNKKDNCSGICINLVMDGEIIEENLICLGLDYNCVLNKIKNIGIYDIEKVFLAVYSNNEIVIFKKEYSPKSEKFIF